MDTKGENAIPVYFGGEARELWTGDGLRVAWSGRLQLLALRDADGHWTAAAPESSGGDPSAGDTASPELELAALLNSGTAPSLTARLFFRRRVGGGGAPAMRGRPQQTP
jgi:hypothetical protein